jgi:cytidylate kinase
LIITIDGPTASGKSTVAKLVAKKLGFAYLNSGLLYRGIAYVLVNFFNYNEAKLVNPVQADLDQITQNHNFKYLYQNDQPQVIYRGIDITAYLKTKEMDNYASISSAAPQVRASLMAIQRQIGQDQDIVAEGRDTGTVVFPQAQLKLFLTASLSVRALRWQGFMRKQGHDYSLAQSEQLVDERDQRDIHRHIAPLVPAQGAVIIDSSSLNIEQVVGQICALFNLNI